MQDDNKRDFGPEVKNVAAAGMKLNQVAWSHFKSVRRLPYVVATAVVLPAVTAAADFGNKYLTGANFVHAPYSPVHLPFAHSGVTQVLLPIPEKLAAWAPTLPHAISVPDGAVT